MKLSKLELQSLKQSLPRLNSLLTELDDLGYKSISISVFKHYMTEKEYDEFDDVDYKTLQGRRLMYENSIRKLYQLTTCYLWRYRRKRVPFIFKPKSLLSVLNKIDMKKQSYLTGGSYEIILPEYSAVFLQDFEWTNILFYQDESKIADILKILADSGLHQITQPLKL